MDKNWKLQRYSRKDYSEVVDFPIEIVGRDGVVRRYSFEDSIRLYQRRVTFAGIRYRDPELVEAEVHHCKGRIDQLRRSFFHRYGWGTPTGGLQPDACFGEYAGEVAAFFRRVLQCSGRPDVSVLPVDGEGTPHSTWFVRPGTAGPNMLLYFFHLDGATADELRERFFETLKMLERVEDPEADCERLVAFHHTADCGAILTARAGDFEALEELRGRAIEPAELHSTPWDHVIEILRRGDQEEAIELCKELVESQPYHLRGYLGGAVLCLGLNRPLDAEDFALIGSRYFPQEGLLHHYLGLARHAQGRTAEMLADAQNAVELAPELAGARFHLAAALLERGRGRAGMRVLRARHPRGGDRNAELALDRLQQWASWRRVMRFGANASLGLGLSATLLGGPLGLVPVAMGFGMATFGTWVFGRQLNVLIDRHGTEDLAQGLRRIHRIAREDEPKLS